MCTVRPLPWQSCTWFVSQVLFRQFLGAEVPGVTEGDPWGKPQRGRVCDYAGYAGAQGGLTSW